MAKKLAHIFLYAYAQAYRGVGAVAATGAVVVAVGYLTQGPGMAL